MRKFPGLSPKSVTSSKGLDASAPRPNSAKRRPPSFGRRLNKSTFLANDTATSWWATFNVQPDQIVAALQNKKTVRCQSGENPRKSRGNSHILTALPQLHAGARRWHDKNAAQIMINVTNSTSETRNPARVDCNA